MPPMPGTASRKLISRRNDGGEKEVITLYRPRHAKRWYRDDEAEKAFFETLGLFLAGVVFWGSLILAFLCR